MARSLIYKSSVAYNLTMRVLYGRHYWWRYRAIADLIPAGSSVVELCCGPGILFDRCLRQKGVEYLGLDMNEGFVDRALKWGIPAQLWDVRTDRPLPRADTVVIQASLYHFLPDPTPVIDRMLTAARRQVIVAEPVKNLTTAGLPMVGWLAGLLTDAGDGSQPHRFTLGSLDAFMSGLGTSPSSSFLIRGEREKVYVISKS